MKICIYVTSSQAKKTYKNECYDVRINAGILVVKDILNRKGYDVCFASSCNVHNFDIVLYSITSDCDWWTFIKERVKWHKGNYKVIAGGSGVLNVRPFLPYVDYFVLGRAEGLIDNLIISIDKNINYTNESIIESNSFNADKNYKINQVDDIYQNDILLEDGKTYHEDNIGCNHRCLFCGYTWHRKQTKAQDFQYSGLWNGGVDRERAMIDMDNGIDINLNKLRTTAIDGFSQRLRFSVNKKITDEMVINFLIKLQKCDKPHQVKIYNIVGLPTETTQDWFEFVECIKKADKEFNKTDRQTSILLHNTPFRAMPATPLACKPMQYINYRGLISSTLGKNLKGNIFYQGNAFWAVESMATDSLSSVIQSAIILRGTEKDSDNVVKLSLSNKYWCADSKTKQFTLEKYFDVNTLFGEFNAKDLPTRYLKTYANIDKMW